MISAIAIGAVSGFVVFVASVLTGMAIVNRGSTADDRAGKWLEPFWRNSNINSGRQASALERIADAIEKSFPDLGAEPHPQTSNPGDLK